MIQIAFYNLVPLGIALAIGLATGRWMFARRAAPPPSSGEPNP